MKSLKPIVAVDFDGVICDRDELIPGTLAAMASLVDLGYRVVVHTLRARTPSGLERVIEWLDERDVPYHEVTAIKPNAVVFVDDRALHFDNWGQALQDINRLQIIQEH